MIVELDFNKVINDIFEEICKAIALRGKALRELVAFFDDNNEIAESLNISDYAAQYLINNIPMDGTSPMSWEFLKEQLDNYTKQIENLQ